MSKHQHIHGPRSGERHPQARLTDSEVRHVRALHHIHGMSYDEIADWFDATPRAIKALCLFERRAKTSALDPRR